MAALSFLLGYENIEEEDESDASSSDDESIEKPVVLLSKEDVYKVSPSSSCRSKQNYHHFHFLNPLLENAISQSSIGS